MRHVSGYTLVEVMVTVALVGVLSALTLSWSRGWVSSMRVAAASGDMMSALFLARSEAVKRRSRVVICKSSDGGVCVSTGGWEQGWIVFHDANDDRVRQNAEAVLSRQGPLSGSTQLRGNSAVERYVSYGPVGMTFQMGTLTVCERAGVDTPARQIIIAAGGRPRLHTTTVAECP